MVYIGLGGLVGNTYGADNESLFSSVTERWRFVLVELVEHCFHFITTIASTSSCNKGYRK